MPPAAIGTQTLHINLREATPQMGTLFLRLRNQVKVKANTKAATKVIMAIINNAEPIKPTSVSGLAGS